MFTYTHSVWYNTLSKTGDYKRCNLEMIRECFLAGIGEDVIPIGKDLEKLTDEEHVQLWEFIVEQTEELKAFCSESELKTIEHINDNSDIEEILSKIDVMVKEIRDKE
jgi:hypothetical protein